MKAKVSLTKGLNFAKFFDLYPGRGKPYFKIQKNNHWPGSVVALNVKAP
jgi:hypothetical protein